MIRLNESSEQVSSGELESILEGIEFRLPQDFLDLYGAYNGGVPDQSEVVDNRHIFSVHEFYDWNDIALFKRDLDDHSVPIELSHEKLLPFACDQGGNTFALYFDKEDPEVYLYTTSDRMTIHGKWSSFGDFLDHFR